MWLALNRKCYDDYSSMLSPYRLATKAFSFTTHYNRPSPDSTACSYFADINNIVYCGSKGSRTPKFLSERQILSLLRIPSFAIKPNAIFVPSIATCCYLHRRYRRIIHLLYADSEKSLFKNEIE